MHIVKYVHKGVFISKGMQMALLSGIKQRLIAKGFHQHFDFNETFSLVIKLTTIKLVLNLVVAQGWKVEELDYLSQTQGHEDKQFSSHVFKLHKALYGLK